MKILAFVDLHGNKKAMRDIEKKAKSADVVVCAGDISIFENDLPDILRSLNKLNKTVIIIPGNHEDEKDLQMLSKRYSHIKDVHNRAYRIENYLFLGYGGGGFSTVDRDFEKLGKKFMKVMKDRKVILVTHAPAYKTKLDDIDGNSCGNKSITNFIKKAKPELVISGHLHENAGKEDKIGKTRLVNPGPYGKIIII